VYQRSRLTRFGDYSDRNSSSQEFVFLLYDLICEWILRPGVTRPNLLDAATVDQHDDPRRFLKTGGNAGSISFLGVERGSRVI
jgi:hypothetical protein